MGTTAEGREEYRRSRSRFEAPSDQVEAESAGGRGRLLYRATRGDRSAREALTNHNQRPNGDDQ